MNEHEKVAVKEVMEKEGERGSDSRRLDANNNSGSGDEGLDEVKSPSSSSGKYKLRPRSAHSRRLCDGEWNLDECTRHKPRSSTLSRYRRKTANARERYRMRQINTAFDSLRGVLPSWVCSRRAAADMTKIATLRLASAYIRSLQEILNGSSPEDTSLPAILDAPSYKAKGLPWELPSATLPTDAKSNESFFNCAETEFISLICDSSSSQTFEDNLVSFLTPMAEPDPTSLLGVPSDSTPGPWGTEGSASRGQQGAPFVT